MRKLLAVLALLAVVGIVLWLQPNTIQGYSSEHEFEYMVQYTGGAGSSDTLPMVIALHGDGGAPKTFFEVLFKGFDLPARFVMLRGPVPMYGKNGWPRTEGRLKEYSDALADAVPELLKKYETTGMPIVTGFSSGGYYSYYLAAFHPGAFSCAMPLSGALPPEVMKDAEGQTEGYLPRVTAFHGKNDNTVLYRSGNAALAYLRRRGHETEMVSFNGDHLDIVSQKAVIHSKLRELLGQLAPLEGLNTN